MKHLFAFLILFTGLISNSISQSAIGSWADHVGFSNCISVCKMGNKIYACNYSSVLIYNKTDNEIEKLNKINGLSDVGIKLLRENPYNNKVMVVYENSNIDFISGDESVANYSDLFRKNFSGKKNINEVLYVGKMAYLSCGFGIALFDTDKLEIKDTYIIGPGGSNLEVFQVAFTDSFIYAATPNGLLRCNHKTKLLNDFNNWEKITSGIAQGYYGHVVNHNGIIIAGYSPFKQSGIGNQDTLYQFSNNTWSKFPYIGFPYHVKKIKSLGSSLCILDQFGSLFFNSSWTVSAYVTQYDNKNTYPSDAIIDGQDYWIADLIYGLIKTGGSNPFYSPNYININGINKSSVSNFDIYKGKIALSPILVNNAGGSPYSKEGLNVFENGEWSYTRKEGTTGDTIIDICSVLIDRKDDSKIWASSWINGLLEFKNNSLIKVYNEYNTNNSIAPVIPNWWRCSGMDMDEDGNLWFAVSDVIKYLSVRKTNGAFQNFTIDGSARFVRKLMCDRNNQIWMLHERDQGLSVCKINKNTSNFSIESYKVLNKNVGNGNLGSNSVFSIAEDKDGKIWVGTALGLRVFNSPGSIFTGGPVDGEPIKIFQDGNVELLLESEVVTCIDVDDANNKWVGTQAGGVFCFSPDGQRQIHRFTKDNSPLYSNEIVDIKCDGKTGNVYIGSTIGIQTYKSVTIEGAEDYSGIKTFPNPVKPGYAGNVYITGLLDNSIVKIADESGNFVWETKSQGGRIEWPLKTFAGNKVTSGVYVVYAALPTAELKVVSKVLVIN